MIRCQMYPDQNKYMNSSNNCNTQLMFVIDIKSFQSLLPHKHFSTLTLLFQTLLTAAFVWNKVDNFSSDTKCIQ